ncbi:MAG: response regulator transcription factor [Lachnospiraceae bacterium]|nr:response regulator transcription factor [Lachnospiraceae bacterium]
MYKILLIDDDAEVLDINKKFLMKEGYQVAASTSAIKAISVLKKQPCDCIILDVMMPEISGFDACAKIREFTDTPIIFLTGKSAEDDRINGLMLGADDYIVKPYSLKELSLRINALMRRRQAVSSAAKEETPSTILSFPPLRIDTVAHKVFCNEEEISLSNREFSLLHLLASHPEKTITFEDIGTKIWGTYAEADRRSIMVNTSRLRKKLEDYPELDGMIETVWSEGYKFIPKKKKGGPTYG